LTEQLLREQLWKSTYRRIRKEHFATRIGKDASQLVEEAVDRLLEYDARFIEAVEVGRATARRGDLIEHDEVVERIEGMFRSCMRVRWTTTASDDLAHIFEYIRKDNPAAARRAAQMIYQSIQGLRRFPHRGRIGLAENTRELVFHRGPTSPCMKSSKTRCKYFVFDMQLRIGRRTLRPNRGAGIEFTVD
jgi:plasmid stabilization system protein ParE/predicted transcriptional regulator